MPFRSTLLNQAWSLAPTTDGDRSSAGGNPVGLCLDLQQLGLGSGQSLVSLFGSLFLLQQKLQDLTLTLCPFAKKLPCVCQQRHPRPARTWWRHAVPLGFGSFLGIIGSNLIENKRQMLVASIVFISFGVIAAFCCAIVDGVFAARHIDLRPLYAGRCQYYSKSTTPPEAICHPQRRAPCTPKIKTNTCFCCDLYNCGKVEISGGYYEYIDVSSCQDIIHLYHLLWSATILNIVGLFLGIITAAILGGFKDMTPSLPTLNCTVENAHPTVSYYSRPQVTSYNTYYHSTPHLPPYSAYDFQHSSVFPASTPSGLSDDPQSVSPSPSYMWSSNAPPRYSPPYFPPFEKPPPYTP
nr:transmembrane protein 255A isoform X2 [Anser cygnoides]